MGRKEKLLEKIKNNPRDVRFEEIDKLLSYYGFVKRNTGGSHNVYKHEELPLRLSIPFNRPIRRPYIEEALKAIESLNID